MWSRCPINQFKSAGSLWNTGLDSDNQDLRIQNPRVYGTVADFRDVQTGSDLEAILTEL